MKVSVNQSELSRALATVVKGSSSRSTLSILSGILIQARDSEIVLQTTDLKLSIRIILPALVEEAGDTVVPAKLFSDIVKNLPDMAVSISTNDQTATIFCNNTTYSLKTLNPLDFPLFPEVEAEQEISFPFDTFASMVKSTAKTVSRDESHPVLTGVLITQAGNTLKMVATDSYRLAVAEVELDSIPPREFEVVVAGTFLQDIIALPSSSDPVTLAFNDNQIVVTYHNATFINRRIEGVFPNYKQLLSTDFTTKIKLSRTELMDAIRRVSLLSNKVSPVQISVDAEAGVITLISTSQDVGNAQESLVCDVEGASIDIAFNYSFMLDGLSSIKTDEISFNLLGEMKPGIIEALGEEQFLYLIMPVRF